jgi:peptidoglycan/xylan/chitin deacetylase (PgdA/CDA1 family)
VGARIVLRLRDALPEPVRERARLALARRLEARVRRTAAVRGAALVFHGVAPAAGDPRTEIEPDYGLDLFDALVGYLARRYRLVRASELLAAARVRLPGEPVPVALTFDDDLRSHLDHVTPVLARRAVTATAFLGGIEEAPWWQRLQAAVDARALEPDALPPLDPAAVRRAVDGEPRAIRRLAAAIEALSPQERISVVGTLSGLAPVREEPLGADGVRALAAAGWEIGFHTVRHDAFPTLDDHALRQALSAGRGELATLAGAPLRAFAYPHGKAGAREAAAAESSGFDVAFTGAAEVVSERTHPFLVGRLQPERSTLGRAALQLARALQEAG